MKTLSVLLSLLAMCSHNVMAQIQLNQGDTLIIPIDTMLTFTGTASTPFRVRQNMAFTLNYDASTLGAGDVLLWGIGSPSYTLTLDSPVNSNITAPWNGLNGEAYLAGMFVNHVQGDLYLTMQSGSVVVDSFFVGVGNPTSPNNISLYSATVPLPVPVPEPGTVSLLCLAGVLLPTAGCLLRRRRQ